jgi:hypothetical protein
MSIVARDQGGNIVNAYTPSTSQVLSCTTTSQQSSAFNANTTLVLVSVTVGHCHIQFGSNPTASVTTSMMIPAEQSIVIAVTGGQKMAFIRDASTAVSTVCVTELL